MSIIVHELENNIWSATFLDESTKWEIVKAETKEPVEAGYYDGYNVADRLLEGVLFKVEALSDKRGFRVSSLERNYDYLKRLNMNHWMYNIAAAVATADCLAYHSEYIDEFMWEHMLIDETDEMVSEIQPIQIPAYNAAELFDTVDEVMSSEEKKWEANKVVSAQPVKVNAQQIQDLLESILNIPKPVEENEHNTDVLTLLKPVGLNDEEQIEKLARLMAQASNFYNEGEDKGMTDEDWLKQGDVEKFRWIARYVFKRIGE